MKLLVSCISTKHSLLKQHWQETGQQSQLQCPLTVLGSYQKPEEDMGGLLCLVEDMGCSRTLLNVSMAAGMVASENGVFVASFAGIHEIDPDRGSVRQDVVSLPLFNALHSLSRTRRGYLVASTGLDLLVEFNRHGEVLWHWWATDHGFVSTPTGKLRALDKALDHRFIRYGTLSQTTHVNSAAELVDGQVLASLFHQGMVIQIDRESGEWHPILEGLDHPHSIRVLDETYFTVADTVRGKALLVKIKDGRGHVEQEVDAGTSWLQDCSYNSRYNCWLLVDGKNSRVILRQGDCGEKPLAQFDFDPEWRLYEAQVL
jgi:hypothetical protein